MKNESNENVPEIGQELHERLCAYVFGELRGDDRAAFEAELARSPALRAEHERLTATIGLVKATVPDDGLSASVRRDLVASARRSRFRIVSGRRVALLAAAAVVVTSGVFAWRLATGGQVHVYDLFEDSRVARQDAPERTRERNLGEAPRAKVSKRAPGDSLEDLRDLGYTADASGAASAPMEKEGSPPSPIASTGMPAPADEVKAEIAAAEPAPGAVLPEAQFLTVQATPPVGTPLPGSSQETGKDGFFLGQGAKRGAASGGAQAAGLPGREDPRAELGLQDRLWRERQADGGARTAGLDAPVGTPELTQEEALLLDQMGYGGGADGEAAEVDALGVDYGEAVVEERKDVGETGTRTGDADAEGYPFLSVDFNNNDLGGFVGVDTGGTDQAKLNVMRRAQREAVVTREQVVVQIDELLDASRLAPGESPRDMFFRYFGDAPFVLALEERTSTFAVDVDTASYALARAYLQRNELPPREAVRTEEFVNYFKADQAPPTPQENAQPFAIGLELAPSLFAKDARTEMLRVTVRAKDVAESERQPVALTFVIDNSGSMQAENRLELVKRTLALLLGRLDANDSVAVVKFSNSAATVMPMTGAARRGELETAIRGLPIEGGTNVEAGLRLGYELALEHLRPGAVNRVILCSDGVGNIGETSAQGLLALVDGARKKGIYLNTVGVGMGNHNDAFLEQLADEGDGVCSYVDGDAEAKRVFVDGLSKALVPVARDVKIQVELDPAQVESWRLLGYENRALRTQDFKNDAIDAGEVNAGHQVTALYELVRHPSRSGPLATVRVRYKAPFAVETAVAGAAGPEPAREIERTLTAASVLPGFAAASNGYQRSVLVAQLAEVLRQSVHARGDSFATLLRESQRLDKALGDPDFSEFVGLLALANPLLDARSREETPLVQQKLDELSRLRYELALRERKRELARQAGEPERSDEERSAEGEADRRATEAIERLEAEVRAEVLRLRGFDPETEKALDDLGYGADGDR